MYRVDRNLFEIGSIIEKQLNIYQESFNFNSDKQKVEKILNEERPLEKEITRNNGLYVFAELSDAIHFSCFMKNSKIYKVSTIHDTTCYHRGDMNWIELMLKFIDNEEILRQVANFYWNGTKTFKPTWEMLVNKVKVIDIIVGDDRTRNQLYLDYQNRSGNVEKIDLYRNNLLKD